MNLPIGIKSLLGLGLKFCFERPRPYQDLCTSLIKFKHDIDICHWLNNQTTTDTNPATPKKPFNRRLYCCTHWSPPSCTNPEESAFIRFEKLIGDLRRRLPCYRRYNLHLIARRCLKKLKENKMIVVHGADKNLGTYVVPKTRYIIQSLNEHMLNPKKICSSSTR